MNNYTRNIFNQDNKYYQIKFLNHKEQIQIFFKEINFNFNLIKLNIKKNYNNIKKWNVKQNKE